VLAEAGSGYCQPLKGLGRAALAAIKTVLITMVVNWVFGVSTGPVEPIIDRSLEGCYWSVTDCHRQPGVWSHGF
jgi:hypothetical protein